MSVAVDCFWSFRSPYSYLATGRAGAARAPSTTSTCACAPCCRSPSARRTSSSACNPLWPPYLLRDTTRIAEYLGIPFGVAAPRPGRAGVPVAPDRGRAAVHPSPDAARRRGRRARARPAVHRRGVAPHLGRRGRRLARGHASRRRGRAAPGSTSPRWTPRSRPTRRATTPCIERNQADLEAAGHWGVPTFAFQGEPFFGQDRIDLLRWRLRSTA